MGKVCPGQCFWFGRVVVQKPHTKADTRLAYSNGNHVRHHGWHMRNMRPVAEDELQRVLTFWQVIMASVCPAPKCR